MKIIIVNDHASIVGGASKMAILSALAFADRGFDVHYFAGIGPIAQQLSEHPGIGVTCLNGIAHNRDPKRLRGAWNGLWDRRAARRFRELLATCDPRETVVHFHAYRDALTASVAYVASKMGFVTVCTAHDYTLGCPYGGFFDYRRNHICPKVGLSMGCLTTHCNKSFYGRKLWFYLSEFIFAKIARIPSRLSHVVFISKLNERVLQPYVGRNTRQSIISNAFDYQSAAMTDIPEDAPFLFIGAMEPHKDPVTAARAAKLLGVPITFVGSGSIEREVAAANPDAVLTGWLTREEVERQIRGCRALVLPSIWYEGQPGTTMEAAACGRAIIVSDVCAGVEQVEQFGIGSTFKAGDPEDLAQKMKPYLDSSFARDEGAKIQAAYRRLDLSADRLIKSLGDVYSQELQRKGYSSSSSIQSV